MKAGTIKRYIQFGGGKILAFAWTQDGIEMGVSMHVHEEEGAIKTAEKLIELAHLMTDKCLSSRGK